MPTVEKTNATIEEAVIAYRSGQSVSHENDGDDRIVLDDVCLSGWTIYAKERPRVGFEAMRRFLKGHPDRRSSSGQMKFRWSSDMFQIALGGGDWDNAYLSDNWLDATDYELIEAEAVTNQTYSFQEACEMTPRDARGEFCYGPDSRPVFLGKNLSGCLFCIEGGSNRFVFHEDDITARWRKV